MISQQCWTRRWCPAFQFQAGTAAFAAVPPQELEARACECETESKGTGRQRGGGSWGPACAPSLVHGARRCSVRLMDQGSIGVVLLPPWTVLCRVVVVHSELREPGAVILCFQAHGLAMLQALHGLVMNRAVTDLCTQRQKWIACLGRAELEKSTYCKATGARQGRRSLYFYFKFRSLQPLKP